MLASYGGERIRPKMIWVPGEDLLEDDGGFTPTPM
jgi:hypothetical protein